MLNLLPFSQSSDQFYDYDEFMYVASPAQSWDTQGDTYDSAQNSGMAVLATGGMDGDGAWLTKVANSVTLRLPQIFNLIWRAWPQNSVNFYVFVGLMRTLPTEANPPVEPTDGYYFRALNDAAPVNWEAVKQDTGVETAVDTGVLFDTDPHDFKILADGDNVKFYIDGTLVATIAQGAANNTIYPGIEGVSQHAGSDQIYVDAYRLQGTRA